ncbi:MAG: LacI family DNA-binding transcriptional regulator [Anaerolineales bacterium]|nr:LacI family DNA-binding transcriptional regulator [Anaerolineales bacterium]
MTEKKVSTKLFESALERTNMATLEEIAKIAGVHRSTVSRVINQAPDVSTETRKKVMDVIQNLNYQPNQAARKLAGGQSHTLGLIIPIEVTRFFVEPYFPILMKEISNGCTEKKNALMLWLTDFKNNEHLHELIHSNIFMLDGLIVSSAGSNKFLMDFLVSLGLPMVSIGRNTLFPDIPFVDVDNEIGARKGTEYLIQMGRKKIGTICGTDNSHPGVDRLAGYQNALEAAGMAYDPDIVVEGHYTEIDGYQAMKKILETKDVDAVFIASEGMGAGAVQAIQERRLRIPDDIALVCFQDSDTSVVRQQYSAYVQQPVKEMAQVSVDMVLELISIGKNKNSKMILPVEFVENGNN